MFEKQTCLLKNNRNFMVIDLTKKLNKIFHERARLGIMSMLIAASEEITFSDFVKKLELTRGNLSVHLKVLESNGFIASKKEFVDNKPRTTYKVTEQGLDAFTKYLSLLEQIVTGMEKK